MPDRGRLRSCPSTIPLQSLQVLGGNLIEETASTELLMHCLGIRNQCSVVRSTDFRFAEGRHGFSDRDALPLAQECVSVKFSLPLAFHLFSRAPICRSGGTDVGPALKLELDIPEPTVVTTDDTHGDSPGFHFELQGPSRHSLSSSTDLLDVTQLA